MTMPRWIYGFIAIGLLTSCATQRETGAARISDDPQQYIGSAVTVNGEVDNVRGDRSFTLEDNDLLLDEDLLVVTDRPLSEMMAAGEVIGESDRLQVHGTVEWLSVADIEREYDFDLVPEYEMEFAGRPVLVADRVSVIAKNE